MIWMSWIGIVWQLRPAFSREKTFLWAVVILAAFCTRSDLAGVTSFVRGHWLTENCYHRLREHFHSKAVKLVHLCRLWVTICLKIFADRLVKINGRYILIADGLKVPKEGRKMPAVKSLHQESQSNSKPEFIMGHSCQCISLLVEGLGCHFALPLISRIHEGLVFSNRDKRTLMDKLIELFDQLGWTLPCYLVADAYYSNRKVISGLLQRGQHLVSRVRVNGVAFEPAKSTKKKGRGRPRLYGRKVKLRNIFKRLDEFEIVLSPVYGESKTKLKVLTKDFLMRPLGRDVRYVFVSHPTRGNIILMSTDTSLSALDIIRIYGWRFKIEVGFKQAIRRLGAYAYHFWMRDMKKIRRGDGDQYLHRESEDYRNGVIRKMRAYENHIQLGLIAQGLLQYMAVYQAQNVWACFGSWMRTMKSDQSPSEMVVAMSLQNTLPEFLKGLSPCHKLKKFLLNKIDYSRAPEYLLAA